MRHSDGHSTWSDKMRPLIKRTPLYKSYFSSKCCVTEKSIGLSDFCITPASFVEDAIVKLDWLNENEVNFFLKCNTEHKKYEKIQKLSLELEDKKVINQSCTTGQV